MTEELLDEPQKPKPSNTRYALAGIAAVFLVFYFIDWLEAPSYAKAQLTSLLFSVFFIIALLLWYQIDAREHGISLGKGFAFLLVFFGILVLPFYLLWSRGLKRGLIAIGWTILFVVSILLLSVIEVTALSLISDRMGLFKDI